MLFLAVCGEPCLEWDQSARSVADTKVLGQACESRTQYKDPASVASATPDALVDPLPSFSPTPLPGPFASKAHQKPPFVMLSQLRYVQSLRSRVCSGRCLRRNSRVLAASSRPLPSPPGPPPCSWPPRSTGTPALL